MDGASLAGNVFDDIVDNKRDGLQKPQDDSVLLEVEFALNRWLQKLLDMDTQIQRSTSFQTRIEECLTKMREEGFLSIQDYAEMKDIGELWINLYTLLATYSIGCNDQKRELLCVLLDLFVKKTIF